MYLANSLTRFLDIENKEFIFLGGFNDLIKMRYGWMVYNKGSLNKNEENVPA